MRKTGRPILVSLAGAILALPLIAGVSSATGAAETRRVTERSVTLDKVPPLVKEALLREAGDHQILEVDEISGPNGLSYEAEWLVDGREVEIRVDSAGRIMGGPDAGEDEDEETEDAGGDDPEGAEDDDQPGN
jgi:hypothetical protein